MLIPQNKGQKLTWKVGESDHFAVILVRERVPFLQKEEDKEVLCQYMYVRA